MDRDDFDNSDLCHCSADSDHHIAHLADEGDVDSIEQLYPWAPVNDAHTKLMRCERDGCPAHRHDLYMVVGRVLARIEAADAEADCAE